jgi:hypothetical protein
MGCIGLNKRGPGALPTAEFLKSGHYTRVRTARIRDIYIFIDIHTQATSGRAALVAAAAAAAAATTQELAAAHTRRAGCLKKPKTKFKQAFTEPNTTGFV